METHYHADHVTAAWLLRKETDCQVTAAAQSNIEGLDLVLRHDGRQQFGDFDLQVLATPGHTPDCISLYLADPAMVFTIDCLLIRGCGRTDFQTGSVSELYHSITSHLFPLADETIVYPGHDYQGRTISTIGEERRLNPRIGGDANEQDFTGFLENMQLPHPKNFDIAVPANLKMGRPDTIPVASSWAPVTETYAGILEVSPQWVAGNLEKVHVLDVRTRVETDEEPARIASVQLIPLDELRDRLDEVPRELPVMTLCRSGNAR